MLQALIAFFKAAAPVVAAGATIASTTAAQESARLQREQQALAARKSRRQAIRQIQLQQAQARAVAAGAGALSTSAFQGGQAAGTSQLGTQMGYSTQLSGLSRGIGFQQNRATLMADVAKLGFAARDYMN